MCSLICARRTSELRSGAAASGSRWASAARTRSMSPSERCPTLSGGTVPSCIPLSRPSRYWRTIAPTPASPSMASAVRLHTRSVCGRSSIVGT